MLTSVSFSPLMSPDALMCPECNCPNLHHFAVKVGFRKKDSDPTGLVVRVTVAGTSTGQEDIVGRRDALHIQFWCERCPARPVLTIMQHKGDSLIGWDTEVTEVSK